MPALATKQKPVGRYTSPGRQPPNGVGQPVPSLNVRTRIGSVQDPYTPGQRIAVSINRRVDVLEDELAHHRISEAAYHAGRRFQAAIEMRERVGSGAMSTGGAASLTGEQKASMAHDRLADILDRTGAYLEWVTRSLGMIDARLLRRALVDRLSWEKIAEMQGKSGARAGNYIATRVRDALEALADAGAAKGRDAI